MIIDYTTNFNTYKEKILDNYSIFDYTCPKCGARHSFTRHGSYERNICFINDDNNTYEQRMCILRLKCASCGSTHAILPSDVIPYCIYSFSFILNVLTKYYSEDNKISDICSVFPISFQLIYMFISKFIGFLNSAFSVLKNLGFETPCIPASVISTISLYHKNKNFLYSYFLSTCWIFLMTKFHNILSPPIYIGIFSTVNMPPT